MRNFTLIALTLTAALSLGCDLPYAETNGYTMLYVEHSGFPTIRDTLMVEPGTCESLLIEFERSGEYKFSVQRIDQVLLYPDLPGATELNYVDSDLDPWASTHNPDPNTANLPVYAGDVGEIQICNPFSSVAQVVTYDVVFKSEDYDEVMASRKPRSKPRSDSEDSLAEAEPTKPVNECDIDHETYQLALRIGTPHCSISDTSYYTAPWRM